MKTTTWITPELRAQVDVLCEYLGVRLNSFIQLALALLVLQLLPVLPGNKRQLMLGDLQKIWDDAIKASKK